LNGNDSDAARPKICIMMYHAFLLSFLFVAFSVNGIHSFAFVGLVRPNVLSHHSGPFSTIQINREKCIRLNKNKFPLQTASVPPELPVVSQETIRLAKLLKARPFFDVGVVGGSTCTQAFSDKVRLLLILLQAGLNCSANQDVCRGT
jgi:hypothetical protein